MWSAYQIPAQQESQSRKLVAKKTWLNVGKGPLRKVGGPKPITGPWPTHFQKWVGPVRLYPCTRYSRGWAQTDYIRAFFFVLMCRRWAVKIVVVFTRKTSHRRRDPNPRNSLQSIRLSYLYALIDCATATVGRKRLKTITGPRQRDICNQSHRGRPRVFAKRQTYFNGILFLTLKHTLEMCRYCRNL